VSDARDSKGKSVEERFAAIREYFLASMKMAGHGRTELYYRPKAGDAREPTEEELVRRWAGAVAVSVEAIEAGVQRGFEKAAELGQVVTSFRYCVPHIVNCATEAAPRRVPL